jgi:hypothetical protein
MLREKFKRKPRKSESTDARHRGGAIRSSEEAAVMVVERRDCVIPVETLINSATRRNEWLRQNRIVLRSAWCWRRTGR